MRPLPPRERYVRALRRAGLGGTAAARDWIAAGEQALRAPVAAVLPLEEAGYFPPVEPAAAGWRVRVQRGQRLEAEATLETEEPARLFLELHEADADGPRLVAWAGEGGTRVEHEAARDGDLVLVVQPELLRGGRYTLRQRLKAALVFPVSGHGNAAVKSVWGDERDGGERRHEGIDIFAPRGTPVVAAADGWVTSVATTEIGGRVVRVFDRARGQAYYYAHLHEQKARAGDRVRAGEVIGTVGNTGNARTTPPHLHFGIYARLEGAVDPLPFVYQPPQDAPPLLADTRALGSWSRVTASGADLRGAPADGAPVLAHLPRHTAVRVEGATGGWFRVRLPDSGRGFLAAARLEPAREPLRRERRDGAAVRAAPRAGADTVEVVPTGAPLLVIGRFGDFLLVRTARERTGWVPAAP